MRKLTQPWKLCRSFGSQLVGSVAAPRWPEAGITTPIISVQSSRWAFTEGQRPIADLLTCGLDSCRRSDVSATFDSKVGGAQASPPKHSYPPKVQPLFGCFIRYYCAAQSASIPSFPLERETSRRSISWFNFKNSP